MLGVQNLIPSFKTQHKSYHFHKKTFQHSPFQVLASFHHLYFIFPTPYLVGVIISIFYCLGILLDYVSGDKDHINIFVLPLFIISTS